MTDRSRLLNIFEKVKKGEDEEEVISPQPLLNMHANSRVLLVDGMNLFLRAFSAVNKFNLTGHHVGGLVGSLRSLGSLVKEFTPTKVIVVFDGEKGSVARKYLYRPYKANRDQKKIVNPKSFRSSDEEKSSKNLQITRLVDYLQTLPVQMMCFDNLEADDVIAYLAKYIPDNYEDSYTYIVSSDQDYLQLVNDRVLVYSPTKKELYNTKKVLSEYGVHPLNHNLFKALIGDTSDNLPGVSGIGEKNVLKLFSDLSRPEALGLDYIYETCEKKPTKSVLYDRVMYVKNTLQTMMQLVDLHSVNIHPNDAQEVQRIYNSKPPAFDRQGFIELYNMDKMGDTIPYVKNWVECFSALGRYK